MNITVESDGKLPSEQLLKLKRELISAFDYQYNHNSHAAFDIRQIYRYPVIGKAVCKMYRTIILLYRPGPL